MMLVHFIAMQGAMLTPLPAEMGPAIEPYSECVSGAFRKRIIAAEASAKLEQASGPKLMAEAITDCASERQDALAASNRALASNPKFVEPAFRAKFVEGRFGFLDDTLVWSVSPEGDPDNWQ